MTYYKIPKDKTSQERQKIHRILKKGLVNNSTTTQIINELKKENLSYRKQDILFDIRLKKSSYNIGVIKRGKDKGKITYNVVSSNKARLRKNKWFIEVFEKFRKENGLTTAEARRIITQEVRTGHRNLLEDKLGKKYWELYKDNF